MKRITILIVFTLIVLLLVGEVLPVLSVNQLPPPPISTPTPTKNFLPKPTVTIIKPIVSIHVLYLPNIKRSEIWWPLEK